MAQTYLYYSPEQQKRYSHADEFDYYKKKSFITLLVQRHNVQLTYIRK